MKKFNEVQKKKKKNLKEMGERRSTNAKNRKDTCRNNHLIDFFNYEVNVQYKNIFENLVEKHSFSKTQCNKIDPISASNRQTTIRNRKIIIKKASGLDGFAEFYHVLKCQKITVSLKLFQSIEKEVRPRIFF